jgi:anti-sigma factor ChrR (cupin superfamily)
VVVSPPRPTTACPEPEILAAYADNALEMHEREPAEAHLVQCARCRSLVALVATVPAESDAAYLA